MFCKKCGNNIPENTFFCSECGTPVKTIPVAQDKSIAPQTPPATPPVMNNNHQAGPAAPLQNNPAANTMRQHTNNNPQAAPMQDNMQYRQPAPDYISSPPEDPTEPPKKKKKAGKIIAIILVVLLVVGLIIPLLIFGIIIGCIFLFSHEESPEIMAPGYGIYEEATTENHATEFIDDTLYYDPLFFFENNFLYSEQAYYRVNASVIYLYSDFGATNPYSGTLTKDDLVYVYGIIDGWACIEYPDAYSGYAWCTADSLTFTTDVPMEDNKYEDPIHYFSGHQKAYYRVTGTGYEGLNLRTEPNTNCDVITVLQESEMILVYGIEDGWAYVRTDDPRTESDLYGWCNAEYITYYEAY